MPKQNDSNYYIYRRQMNARRGRKKAGVILLLLALLLVAAGGAMWLHGGTPVPAAGALAATAEQAAEAAPTPQPTPAPTPSPTPAPTPQEPATAEAAQADYTPRRLLAQVDNAAWDTSTRVEPTLNQDYLNTDHRMVALPMLGTVTRDYFNTVTFVGDSLASGLGIYTTGYQNAHYATYIGAGVDTFVYNQAGENAVTGATDELPLDTIVASQPDYVYFLVGTNNLVSPNTEEKLLAFYERMIDDLRAQLNPGVIFYIQAIPGVQEDVVQSRPGLDNTRIFNVNNLLANLALRKGCYFVNIREALTNPDGSMIDAYDAEYDGVHFNPAGYGAWAEYLATHTAWNRRSIYYGENPWTILGS